MKREFNFKPGQTCRVEGCSHLAEYEVYLYDYYHESDGFEFMEQDYTCPFLCETHMQRNETLIKGERKPRHTSVYPYTNKHAAQGYTKYIPIRDVFPELFDQTSLLESSELRSSFVFVNDQLLQHLARHPNALRTLEPRRFEELVAELFCREGFSVELTPKTRDGGKDMYAVRKEKFGTILYVIECKRYSEAKKVGVEAIRGLYGVACQEKATAGVLATTSTFTKGALDFAAPLKYQLSLRNFDALQEWLNGLKFG